MVVEELEGGSFRMEGDLSVGEFRGELSGDCLYEGMEGGSW